MKNKEYIYLSKVKFDVLNYIKKFIKDNEYSPTLAEIASKLGFTRARAGVIVMELFSLGLISKGNSSHRKIRMSNKQIALTLNLQYNREYKLNEFTR
jgi:predicted transcriptional regulator